MTGLKLTHGLDFADLYDREGLARLDALFLDHLRAGDEALAARLEAARGDPSIAAKDESDLILALAPLLEDFIAELFGIEAEIRAQSAAQNRLSPIFACKRLFVQRQAVKAHSPEAAESFDGPALGAAAILTFRSSWNSYLEPLVYLNSLAKFTLPVALNNFRDSYGLPVWELQLAATTLAVVPVLAVYVGAQRYITNAMAFSGLKG